MSKCVLCITRTPLDPPGINNERSLIDQPERAGPWLNKQDRYGRIRHSNFNIPLLTL